MGKGRVHGGREAAELPGVVAGIPAPTGAVAQRPARAVFFLIFLFKMYLFKISYKEGASESSVTGQGAFNTKINLLKQQSKTSTVFQKMTY